MGCLLGGALGDSLGSRFEGDSPQEFSVPKELRVTDDTQLTLATCESIIERNGIIDPESIASNMTRWFRERRLSGLGSSTLKSLTELNAGGHWAMTGASGERSAGNGAAMRISPIAFFLDPNQSKSKTIIRDVCRITHRNDEAYLGALSVLYTIHRQKLDRNVISELISKLPDSRTRDRFIEIETDRLDFHALSQRRLPTGYVIDSIPFSILAAVESQELLPTIRMMVECGGDTDTNTAIYGNIVGSLFGLESIPIEVASKINDYELILETGEQLAIIAGLD